MPDILLTHSKKLSISEIMLLVQRAEEFPIRVKIDRGTCHIKNKDQATMFSLGILAALDAKDVERTWE